MLAEYRTRTNIGIAVGIILQITGRALPRVSDGLGIVGGILTLVGAVAFVWGCMNYAEGKGHSKWLGLLGLLSCLGLIVLLLLPDHNKDA